MKVSKFCPRSCSELEGGSVPDLCFCTRHLMSTKLQLCVKNEVDMMNILTELTSGSLDLEINILKAFQSVVTCLMSVLHSWPLCILLCHFPIISLSQSLKGELSLLGTRSGHKLVIVKL